MKSGIVKKSIMLAALLALSGCTTINPKPLTHTGNGAILSAEEARAMIRVEVTVLEPLSADSAVAASKR